MSTYSNVSITTNRNKKTHTYLYIYYVFLLCLPVIFGSTTFDFQILNTTNFKFLGDAHMLNNTVRLTSDPIVPNSGAGLALYNKPIELCQPGNLNPASFATYFSFTIFDLNPNSFGGGLAFLISPDDRSIGAPNAFLGIPAESIAVEFDTVKDTEFKDVNGNHVGLNIKSMVSLKTADLDLVNVNLRSGELIHSWVEYSGSNHQFKVYISNSKTKPESPVLSVNIDLGQYINDFMFLGFSGSTQGSTEVHSIEYWNFTSAFDDPNSELGPPTISTTDTTRKYDILNKLIRVLVGVLVAIAMMAGGISIYLKYQNGDQSQYYNICNCCSYVNNVAH